MSILCISYPGRGNSGCRLRLGAGRFSSSGAGAVVSAAGEALLPGRDGGLPGGSGKTGGVSRAGYRAIYPHPLPPFTDFSALVCQLREAIPMLPLGGMAEKGGGGFYVIHYENNGNPLCSLDEICLNEVGGTESACLLCQSQFSPSVPFLLPGGSAQPTGAWFRSSAGRASGC